MNENEIQKIEEIDLNSYDELEEVVFAGENGGGIGCCIS